jgi:hypothetical protein
MAVEDSRRTTVGLNVRVPYDVRRELKVYAAENGLTLTELLIGTFQRAGILSLSSAGPAGSPISKE